MRQNTRRRTDRSAWRVALCTHHAAPPPVGALPSPLVGEGEGRGAPRGAGLPAFTSPLNLAQTLGNLTSPQDIHKENQRFIHRNLLQDRQIPLRDSPSPGQPSLTAPDRKTPDGRNGLRAAAGGKAGRKPGSDHPEVHGRAQMQRVSRPRGSAGKRAMRLRTVFGPDVAGVLANPGCGKPGNGRTHQEGVRGVARPMQGPRPSTWRLF